MESEGFDIRSLREWTPLTDVFQKIPPKVQKGFFFQELNVTCIDILPEFIALGTDAGIVFWYNRKNGNAQKLRTESTAAITCIKLISSVEYMVAVGNTNGEVAIFQIQKELPPDLVPLEIAASLQLTKKPIERYTIRDACRASITCVEWSKNGMKLFSGDAQGVVVLTEIDFIEHISRSSEILNEAYGIVQLGFISPWLLVSTLYRAVICAKEASDKWKVSQIGRTDRKVLNNFGAVFMPSAINSGRQQRSIVCSRPGFRFWMADIDGNVSHTFLLKDSVIERSMFEVPLLNPVHKKTVDVNLTHFGPCHYYNGSFIVTYCESIVFIINLEKLKVVATIKRLRKIQYLAINGSEIFILEGGRSLVRLAPAPEATLAHEIQQMQTNGKNSLGAQCFHRSDHKAEIEEKKDVIVDADECIELPPIEYIQLDTPLSCHLNEHNLLKEDKLLLEHSRKLKVFESINRLDYDESILFNTGTRKKKKLFSNATKYDSIVEIGRQADSLDQSAKNQTQYLSSNDKLPMLSESNSTIVSNDSGDHDPKFSLTTLTTTPSYLDASFCDGINLMPDLRSPTTIERELQPKEERLANMLDIKPISCAPIEIKSEISSYTTFTPPHFTLPPKFSYPLDHPTIHFNDKIGVESNARSSLSKIHLINDDEDDGENIDQNIDTLNNAEVNTAPSAVETADEMSTTVVPKLSSIFTKIPKLWDIQIEKFDENNRFCDEDRNATQEGSDSDWEFL